MPWRVELGRMFSTLELLELLERLWGRDLDIDVLAADGSVATTLQLKHPRRNPASAAALLEGGRLEAVFHTAVHTLEDVAAALAEMAEERGGAVLHLRAARHTRRQQP